MQQQAEATTEPEPEPEEVVREPDPVPEVAAAETAEEIKEQTPVVESKTESKPEKPGFWHFGRWISGDD